MCGLTPIPFQKLLTLTALETNYYGIIACSGDSLGLYYYVGEEGCELTFYELDVRLVVKDVGNIAVLHGVRLSLCS